MGITLVQQGLIAQQEFAKLLMMGSGGKIEVAAPLTDDERRDYEIHVRGRYDFGLAIQCKSTMQIRQAGGRAYYLHCQFPVRATRVVNNPLYWYFIAFLDPKLMGFRDPVFLIPSEVFHKNAAPRRVGAFWWFNMMASMDVKTRDQWHAYRVKAFDLGSHVATLMEDLRRQRGLTLAARELPHGTEPLWVRPRAA